MPSNPPITLVGNLNDVLKIVRIERAPKPGAHIGLMRDVLAPDPLHDPRSLVALHARADLPS